MSKTLSPKHGYGAWHPYCAPGHVLFIDDDGDGWTCRVDVYDNGRNPVLRRRCRPFPANAIEEGYTLSLHDQRPRPADPTYTTIGNVMPLRHHLTKPTGICGIPAVVGNGRVRNTLTYSLPSADGVRREYTWILHRPYRLTYAGAQRILDRAQYNDACVVRIEVAVQE